MNKFYFPPNTQKMYIPNYIDHYHSELGIKHSHPFYGNTIRHSHYYYPYYFRDNPFMYGYNYPYRYLYRYNPYKRKKYNISRRFNRNLFVKRNNLNKKSNNFSNRTNIMYNVRDDGVKGPYELKKRD